jgi:hypothetical protein
MGAALFAHEVLQALAAFRLGAHTFAEHEHTAVGPALFVELLLAFCMLGGAVREALGVRHAERSALAAPSRLCLARAGAGIAVIAGSTLFGMEFIESPSTALGLGWLGGALFPGAVVLALAAAAATALLHAAVRGKIAGLARLVSLCAAAFARLAGLRAGPAPALQPFSHGGRRAAPTAPSSRHGGLRAPPLPR